MPFGSFARRLVTAVTRAAIPTIVAFVASGGNIGVAAAVATMSVVSSFIPSKSPSIPAYSINNNNNGGNPTDSGSTSGGGGIANEIRGQLVTSKSPADSARIVYGRTRLGGNVVFYESVGDINQTLYQVACIAGHEITAVDEVYLDNDKFEGSYKGNASAFTYFALLGTDNQPATGFFSETSAATYRYRGLACLISRFVYNQDTYVNGVPNVTAIVRGKRVYDPRFATTDYSNNASLVIRDYLLDTRFGLAAKIEEIDEASFISAATICDQVITLANNTTEKRYTINGSFTSDQMPKDVLNKMLSSCGGVLTYSGGKWTLKVAAWRAPTVYLTENEVVGDITMQASQSRRDIFNSVKGTYSSALDLYQPVSFPPVTNSTYVAEDGETIWQDVQYPLTTSYATCQRLAKIELEKARQQIIVNLSVNLKGFAIQPADNVYFTFARYGWNNKTFEVLTWEFGTRNLDGVPIPVVNLVLKETAAAVYDWNSGEETTVDPSPNTTLPNAFSVNAPSNLIATNQVVVLQDGTTQNGIVLTWTAPVSSFVSQYEVQWIRGSGSSDWGLITAAATEALDYGLITAGATLTEDWGSIADPVPSAETTYNSAFTTVANYTIVPAVEAIEYTIKVRAYNALGVRSAFTTLTTTPTGDVTPPALPDAVTILAGYKQLTITWNNPADADFDYVEIFSNTVNNLLTASRAGVARASNFVHSALGINQTRYYWLRSVDNSGNRSNFTSVFTGTTSFIDSDIFSSEVMNLFSEAGAYGIEPVATLPATGDFDGQIKYDTTANKLYRWDTTSSPPAWNDDIFSITSGSVDLASFAAGLEPIAIVNTLPSTSGYTGAKVVFLTTDGKLYRYTGGAWTTSVLAVDLSGTLSATNFGTDLRPAEIVAALPSSGNFTGRLVVLTTDGKLYRYTSGGWTSAVPAVDVTGTLTNSQIADLAATKITGTLSDAQIADLAAAKITGQITGTQITDGAISTPKLSAGSVTTDKLTASSITADKIATNAITSDKIIANAITTGKLAVGAVTAIEIASSTITADKLAANSITSNALSANSITSAKIAAGAITTDLLAANAVTAGKISAGAINTAQLAAGAVTSDKILAGSIQTDRIAANAITGGLIAASGVITQVAQITDGVITNAKIANLAVDSGKIGDLAVTTAKIGDLAVTSAKIENANITTAKIADLGVTTAKIADLSVTGAKIVDASITSAKIGDAQITSAKIADAQISTAKIIDANITTLKVAGNAITVPITSYTGGNYADLATDLEGNEYRILVIATFTNSSTSFCRMGDSTGQYWSGTPIVGTITTQTFVVTRSGGYIAFYAEGGDGPRCAPDVRASLYPLVPTC